MADPQTTYCRICESACGLVATVHEDRVVALQPDAHHPRSRGYACRKGVRFHEIHHAPDRLRSPQWRETRDASFAEVSWDGVMSAVGDRLQDLQRRHGPGAVGVFSGNAAGQSLGSILGVTALVDGLGTPRHYSALTLDNSEMFVVTEACLGHPLATFVADYEGSDLIALFGTDPLGSQASQAQSHPSAVREILQVAREGQLVVIDPRPSVTSRRASLHLKPRPGTDVALLAYLVSEVLRSAPERAASDPLLVPQDVEIVRRAVAPWTRERAASVTGLDAADLHRFRTLLLNAQRPLVWSGLGILLGPDGTVGYWLTLVLQAVLGRLDRRGGWLLHGGAVNLPALTRWASIRGYDTANRSRIGQYPSVLGTWASATLTDDILDPSEDRLRALVVVGGNPAVSLPDSTRAREALSALELLVVLDLRPSQTTALAHAVLPAKSWLARADVGLHQSSTRRRLDLLVSPAVVPGVGQSREDWDILLNLTRAAGKKAFGSWMADLALRASGVGPYGMARALLWGRTLGGIQVDTERGFFGDEAVIGKLRTRGTHRPEGTVKLGVDAFVKALPSAAGLPCPATSHRVLQVITSVRPIQKMNSWISGRHAPSCRLHPLDIARLGGRHIRIRRPGRQGWDLTVTVTADEGLRPGTLVLPWGDPRLDVNAVIGTERLEPFTGQPISNGCWVEVAPDDRSERHVDPL